MKLALKKNFSKREAIVKFGCENFVIADLESKFPGVVVENKGLSISIHYRHATDSETARNEIESFLQTLEPLPRILQGKFVINVLPRLKPTRNCPLGTPESVARKDKALRWRRCNR